MEALFEYKPLLVFCIALAAVLGAVLGSFLNCTAWRIAHGESWVRGRSRCPECGHELGALELVPVFSWLFLRGRCKSCGSRISARYPLTELIFAAVTVLCMLRFGLTAESVRNYVFLCCLYCLSLTDIDSRIIPDGCQIVSASAWLAALPFTFISLKDTLLHIAAAVLFGGGVLLISLAMDRIMGRDTMGGGDIKLIAVSGLYLGMAGSLLSLLLACILGLASIRVFRKAADEDGAFPFGPSLAAAAAVTLLYGGPAIDLYLSLF